MKIKILALFVFLSGLVLTGNNRATFRATYTSGVSGINGKIVDAVSGEPLPARIILKDENGNAIDSYYNVYPGFFSEEDGTFHKNLTPGAYSLTATHGIDYISRTYPVSIKKDTVLTIEIGLEPWVPLRKLGWVNGDGHAHLYTEKHPDDSMLTTVRRICRAQGVDFISTNQGWAGYNDDNWRAGYARFSDQKFYLHYGAEMPKYRTGHTWWLGLNSCRHYFDAAMDTTYENQYYQSPERTKWDFASLPFPNIPAVELVPRFKKAEKAVALIPHPTSWWWQKRGNIEKYTTNVCEYLPFSLAAGGIWDGIVVMGYDSDHYFYQNLWFHILNEGYRMTPVSELDGGYGKNNKFPYGSMRVYYRVGNTLSMDSIVDAVKKGRTFVTSGPIVFADIDSSYQTGDIIPADGRSRTLHISAFASGDEQDYLSYIIVFRNGAIHTVWDLRRQKLRQSRKQLEINEDARAWYVIKAYGKNAWENPEHLDVMAVCKQIQDGTFSGVNHNESTVCLTSPFYYRPDGMNDPKPLSSRINLTLIHPVTKQPVKNASIDILLCGEKINQVGAPSGKAEFTMPVNAYLVIRCENMPVIRRSLYLDYRPHQEILENFANGNWQKQNNRKGSLGPGQVPWEAFQFEKTREVLSKADWNIELKSNERDNQWQSFDALFPGKKSDLHD